MSATRRYTFMQRAISLCRSNVRVMLSRLQLSRLRVAKLEVPRELGANFRSLRRCSSVRASRWNTLSWWVVAGRRDEGLYLQRRPIKISKLFRPAKFVPPQFTYKCDTAKNSHFVCEIAVPSLRHGEKCIYIMSWRRKLGTIFFLENTRAELAI